MTVCLSNYSHPTGVVNRFTGPPSHITIHFLLQAPTEEYKWISKQMRNCKHNQLNKSPPLIMYVINIEQCIDKKDEIWLSPKTKAPTPTEMSKGQSDNTNNAITNLDLTATADWLRTVGWSNYSHQTGVVNRFTGPSSHITNHFLLQAPT